MIRQNKQQNKWLFFSLLWFAAIIYGLLFHSSAPDSTPPLPHFDKWVHALLFFIQFWFISRACFQANKQIPYIALWCGALGLAVGTEWAQAAFTTTRQADIWDGVADMTGASIALILAYYASEIWRKKALSANQQNGDNLN